MTVSKRDAASLFIMITARRVNKRCACGIAIGIRSSAHSNANNRVIDAIGIFFHDHPQVSRARMEDGAQFAVRLPYGIVESTTDPRTGQPCGANWPSSHMFLGRGIYGAVKRAYGPIHGI